MTIVGDYIRGDAKAGAIFGEVRSVLYVVGLIGSMDHVTGFGADLKFISTLRSPLAALSLLRLIGSRGQTTDQPKDIKAKTLKLVSNIRLSAKLTGWILTELQVASPLAAACSQASTYLWYGLTFGKLVFDKDAKKLTRTRQCLTLAMIPISWTAFGKANPDIITGGFLFAALMGLRESQLAFRKLETKKTS